MFSELKIAFGGQHFQLDDGIKELVGKLLLENSVDLYESSKAFNMVDLYEMSLYSEVPLGISVN